MLSSHLQSFTLSVEQPGDVSRHVLHQLFGCVSHHIKLTSLLTVYLHTAKVKGQRDTHNKTTAHISTNLSFKKRIWTFSAVVWTSDVPLMKCQWELGSVHHTAGVFSPPHPRHTITQKSMCVKLRSKSASLRVWCHVEWMRTASASSHWLSWEHHWRGVC